MMKTTMKPGDKAIFQAFGHACAVTYKTKRYTGTVLAVDSNDIAVIAWDASGIADRLSATIPVYRLGERP